MANYGATISWRRNGAVFSDNKYSRVHSWLFDGGAEIRGSASPQIVPTPLADPAGVDPEEAFVAALSSCHMLWFLAIACKQGFIVDDYQDAASGIMQPDSMGKLSMTHVTLRPIVSFAGPRVPDRELFLAMHHEAHAECFIANSVKSVVLCEPVIA